MPGTLFLIPNTLGPTEAHTGALDSVLPGQVQAITSQLGYFVAENAKTGEAEPESFARFMAERMKVRRALSEQGTAAFFGALALLFVLRAFFFAMFLLRFLVSAISCAACFAD